MKDLSLLVWVTQLGLSVALPFAGFLFLALWLRTRFGWGDWVVWVGVLLGAVAAFDGLRYSLKTLSRLSREEKKDGEPPTAFNEHD